MARLSRLLPAMVVVAVFGLLGTRSAQAVPAVWIGLPTFGNNGSSAIRTVGPAFGVPGGLFILSFNRNPVTGTVSGGTWVFASGHGGGKLTGIAIGRVMPSTMSFSTSNAGATLMSFAVNLRVTIGLGQFAFQQIGANSIAMGRRNPTNGIISGKVNLQIIPNFFLFFFLFL